MVKKYRDIINTVKNNPGKESLLIKDKNFSFIMKEKDIIIHFKTLRVVNLYYYNNDLIYTIFHILKERDYLLF